MPVPGRRSRLDPRLRLAISVALAVVFFWVLLSRVDVGEVVATIRAMTWLELLSLVAVALWDQVAHWLLWVAVTPGLSLGRAAVLAEAGTAVTNAVPGGSGVGIGLAYELMESWGIPRERATRAVLVSGLWNSFAKLGLPVLALGLLALSGHGSGGRVALGVLAIALLAAAIALLVLVLRSERVAAGVGTLAARVVSWARGLAHRPPVSGWDRATVAFRAGTAELLTARLAWITAAALVSQLSLYLVLLLALRHVGIGEAALSWVEVLAVFAFARLLTMVRFTPGGAGVVEAVLIGGLVAAGGPSARVTAAVLVFRALTWLLPVPIGAVAWLAWRLGAGRRRSFQGARAAR